MILSFAEFNALYESYNDVSTRGGYDEYVYSDGAHILEELFMTISENGSLTEEEVANFLDKSLIEEGWQLNEDEYSNYLEWLEDYSNILDESYSEDYGYTYSLTTRGEAMLNEGILGTIGDKAKGTLAGTKDIVSRYKMDRATGGTRLGAAKDTWKTSSKGQKIGRGVAGGLAAGAAGVGIYKGVKALKKRRDAKKQAQGQPAPQGAN